MDMFDHYYPESARDDDSIRADAEDREREIIWAVHDFADCCERYSFLEMMRLLTDELQKRKRSNKE